ncbi:MAG: HTTM domain-containing protein [Verrucomicrobiota bacterium]
MRIELKQSLRDLPAHLFGIDLRSLAVFRIGAGLLILYDLIHRARDLTAHYTELGVMPRENLKAYFWADEYFTIHALGGSPAYAATLFAIAGLCAVALILGYRTRLFTILSWFFLISLQTRNIILLNGGDIVFRLMLFWGMFLPLGARWSLDSLWRNVRPSRPRVLHTASFCFILQLALVYVFNFFTKSDDIWRVDHDALYYAMHLDYLSSGLGKSLLQYPELLRALTRSTLFFELCAPFLLLVPFFTAKLRTFTVFSFIGFHLGLIIFMDLGLFPYICIVYWLALLPPGFWTFLHRRGLRRPSIPPPKGLRFLYHPIETAEFKGKAQLQRTGAILAHLFCAFTMAYVMLWNLRTVNPYFEKRLPDGFNRFGYALVIFQEWNMFAPYPVKDDGWYLVKLSLKDGSEVDGITGGAFSFDKPSRMNYFSDNPRWRKYMSYLRKTADWNKEQRYHFENFIRTDWDRRHRDEPDRQVAEIRTWFMRERTGPPGTPTPFAVRKDRLHPKAP